MILEFEPGLRVVAEAADGAEAVAQCRTHRPDVALLDVRMPSVDGLQAARRMRRSLAGHSGGHADDLRLRRRADGGDRGRCGRIPAQVNAATA